MAATKEPAKRKLSETGFTLSSALSAAEKASEEAAKELKRTELFRRMISQLSQDQWVEVLVDAAKQHPSVLAAVRSILGKDPATRKLFIRGLGVQTTSEGLRATFSKWGEVEEGMVILDKVTGKSRGFGFLTFRHVDSCLSALQDPAKRIDGCKAQCHLAAHNSGKVGETTAPELSSRKIYIGNLPEDCTCDMLRSAFSGYGEIEEGPMGFDRATGKCKGFSLILYKTAEGAKNALAEANKVIDGNQVYCKLATEGKKQKTSATLAQGSEGTDMMQAFTGQGLLGQPYMGQSQTALMTGQGSIQPYEMQAGTVGVPEYQQFVSAQMLYSGMGQQLTQHLPQQDSGPTHSQPPLPIQPPPLSAGIYSGQVGQLPTASQGMVSMSNGPGPVLAPLPGFAAPLGSQPALPSGPPPSSLTPSPGLAGTDSSKAMSFHGGLPFGSAFSSNAMPNPLPGTPNISNSSFSVVPQQGRQCLTDASPMQSLAPGATLAYVAQALQSSPGPGTAQSGPRPPATPHPSQSKPLPAPLAPLPTPKVEIGTQHVDTPPAKADAMSTSQGMPLLATPYGQFSNPPLPSTHLTYSPSPLGQSSSLNPPLPLLPPSTPALSSLNPQLPSSSNYPSPLGPSASSTLVWLPTSSPASHTMYVVPAMGASPGGGVANGVDGAGLVMPGGLSGAAAAGFGGAASLPGSLNSMGYQMAFTQLSGYPPYN